jgi:type I restriction enzyme, S subunit
MNNHQLKPKIRFKEFENSWSKVRIDEVVDRYVDPVNVNKEEIYKQIGIRSHGKGIFHKKNVSGKELGNKRVFWLKSDLFVVNIVFAWEQAIAKTTKKEEGLIASHRFPQFIPLDDKLDLNFILYFFLRKKGKHILELASPGGAGRNKTLGQKEFAKSKIQIPEIQEQYKIASFLSAVDNRIDLLKQKKDKLSAYKKGVMQHIFGRDIRFTDDNGINFPNWKEYRLDKIGKTYTGLSGKTKEDFGSGKPYIQYKQIFNKSSIDISKCDLVQLNESEIQSKVQYGDIFFTTSSETPDEICTSSVLLETVDKMYLNSFCFGYRPNMGILKPDFAQFLFRSQNFRRKVIRLAQGSTRYNMSKKAFLKLNLLLPCLEEQGKIAAFLTSIDEKIELVEKQIEGSNQFKKGLLQQMFV